MKTRRERLLLILLGVLCIYAFTLKDSISEAITTVLFEEQQTVAAAAIEKKAEVKLNITATPDEGKLKSGTKISIKTKVENNLAKISNLTIKVNGKTDVNVKPNAYSRTVTFSKLSDGKYEIEVTAKTTSGKEVTKTFNYQIGEVDTTAPEISYNNTPSSTIYQTSKLIVTVQDKESYISKVEYKWDDEEWKTVKLSSTKENEISFDVDKGNSTGRCPLEVRVENKAGKSNSKKTWFTIYDNKINESENAPTIYESFETTSKTTSITPSVANNSTIKTGTQIKVTVKDTTNKISKIEYKLNGKSYSVTPNEKTHNLYFGPLKTDGRHDIEVVAWNAKNEKYSASYTYYVGNTSNNIESTTGNNTVSKNDTTMTMIPNIKSGSTVSEGTKIEVTIEDSNSKIGEVICNVDGININSSSTWASKKMIQTLSLKAGTHTITVTAKNKVGQELISKFVYYVEGNSETESDKIIIGGNKTEGDKIVIGGNKIEEVPSTVLYGDANGDGKVDISDSILVLQSPSKDKVNWENADVFKDGKLDEFDAQIINSAVAGGYSITPHTCGGHEVKYSVLANRDGHRSEDICNCGGMSVNSTISDHEFVNGVCVCGEKTEEKIEDIDLLVAVRDVTNLGIMEYYEDGTFRPDEKITRAQMTEIVGKMIGISESTAEEKRNEKSRFTDVKTGEWYTGWINAIDEKGMLTGFPKESKFRPNDNVTLNEILTFMINVLGRGEYISKMGGDYVAEAARLNLLKYVNSSSYDTRGAIAIIIHNTLDTEVWGTNLEGDELKTLRELYYIRKYEEPFEKVSDTTAPEISIVPEFTSAARTITLSIQDNESKIVYVAWLLGNESDKAVPNQNNYTTKLDLGWGTELRVITINEAGLESTFTIDYSAFLRP